MGRMRMGGRLLAGALLAGAVALILVAVGVGSTTPLAPTSNGITPLSYEGNIAECTEGWLNPAISPDIDHVFGLEVEKGNLAQYGGTFDKTNTSHTHGDDNPLRATITNPRVSGGRAMFDWSANMPVDFVVVKASTTSLVYDYRNYDWGGHPATGPWGDTNLASPKDSISHVLFCTLKKLRVEKTAAARYTRTYQWTINKQVKAGGSAFGKSAALSLLTGDSGAATWQIVADQTGSTDGDASVAGSITILDASPFDVSGVADESLSNVTFGGACTNKAGTTDQANFSVLKGKTIACSYSAPTTKSAGTLTNTVIGRSDEPRLDAVDDREGELLVRQSDGRGQQDRALVGLERPVEERHHRRRHLVLRHLVHV